MFRQILSQKSRDNFNDENTANYKWRILWPEVVYLSLVHLATFYLFYLIVTLQVSFKRFAFITLFGMTHGIGTTAGAHRLWTHRSYKATLPLRIILMLAQSASMQNNLFEWVRDHREHHKFSETDADPHNPTRGFFFAHCGWLMVRKHPEVRKKAKTIDMSDIFADPVVKFQLKYYAVLAVTLGVILPVALQHYIFGDSLWTSFVMRIGVYGFTLNTTWSVNSAAHLWGTKPYDKSIRPAENRIVAALALGEGFHNYHHVFPWDYKTSELGNYSLNLTTGFLDLMAYIGWAYELKSASNEMILDRMARTGVDNTLKEQDADSQ